MKKVGRFAQQCILIFGMTFVFLISGFVASTGWSVAGARSDLLPRMSIAAGGGFIFYYNGFYGGEGDRAPGLFRARPDGTEEQRLIDCNPMYIVYDDGWVYYEDGKDQFGNAPTVYKIRPDGSENTKVAEMGIWAIQDGVIFDASKDANGNMSVRRFAPGDAEPVLIHAADVAEMIVDENFLYFTLRTYGGSCIYRMDHNGQQVKQLNTQPSENLSLQDGFLYYQEYNILWSADRSIIKRMKTDGSQQEELFRTLHYFTQSDGFLYYSDDFLNIKRVPVGGGQAEQLTKFRENPWAYHESTTLLSCVEGRLYLLGNRMNLSMTYMTLPADGGDATVFGPGKFEFKYYTDIPAGHPAHDAITYFSRAGVVSGRGDGTFDPDAPLTRAELCKVFERLNWYPEQWLPLVEFSDLSGHWAEESVSLMQEYGLVSGYPDGTFRPDNPVTVQEFLKVMVSALGEDNGALFYPEGYIEKARALSVRMDGISDFNAQATREQVIVMLYSIIPLDGIAA